MYARQTIFVLAIAALLLIFMMVVSRVFRPRISARSDCRSLIERLVSVDRDMIAKVAMDWKNRCEATVQEEHETLIDPSELWGLIGGLKGLEALERNCEVLIELACAVQRWHPEAVVVAEELRLNTREIEWHLGRLRAAAKSGRLRFSFPDYAQRAVATYYTMALAVVALYEANDVPGAMELQRVL